MLIDGNAVLHIVHVASRLGNEARMSGKSTEDIWAAFVQAWATVYDGYQNELGVDTGSIFISVQLSKCTDALQIAFHASGVERHFERCEK